MKKLVFVMVLITIFTQIMFADTKTLEYQFKLSEVESYNIGFYSSAIDNFNSITSLSTTQNLKATDGEFVGTLETPLYVFWQIQSPNNYDITLTASQMKSTADKLNVKLSTDVPDRTYSTGSAPAYLDDGSAHDAFVMSTDSAASGGLIYSYVAADAEEQQSVGSQQVILETENFQGKKADTYKGTLTLIITEKGDMGA